ncbi:hypothetical protein Pint_29326 [Pistacia integerrima]|uniref:Uncharacterized protein n=1 Tax=Pistacia integerrima TaxID=434235 RepID=A0ACC0X0C5_9ROSI|nr:hypothetical protein Pint_29326 [Pistacia integerrima]
MLKKANGLEVLGWVNPGRVLIPYWVKLNYIRAFGGVVLYTLINHSISKSVPPKISVFYSFILSKPEPNFPDKVILETNTYKWWRSASFILDYQSTQNEALPSDSITLSPPPLSASTAPAAPQNPNFDRNMSVSAYYQTRAVHHVVVTSDWLAQAQEAATMAAGLEVDAGVRSGRTFSVIEEFNNWRKQPDLAEAVAAIRALVAVFRNSEANTMMELEA